MSQSSKDFEIRMAVFNWLQAQVDLHGPVLSRKLLAIGPKVRGEHVCVVGPQGIFKPKQLSEVPLSITTSPNSPYQDCFDSDGLLSYAYRGTNPLHHENVGLRKAMGGRVPLVYLHGLMPGKYVAAWPAYVVGDHKESLMFKVAVDDVRHVAPDLTKTVGAHEIADTGDAARRVYITGTFRRRIHQQAFRERVLQAYHQQCALCRLRHEELLDAAHIIADSDPQGEPVVQNGLALCKLHHAAYDRNFLAVRPDYVIEVRRSILDEEDGPMLQHGLKELHERPIALPRLKTLCPDRDRLDRRYQEFRESVS